WNLCFKYQGMRRGAIHLAIAAVFPGSIYDHVVSPTSMMVALTFGLFFALIHKKYRLAFILALLGGMTHTESVFLPVVILLWSYRERAVKSVRETIARVIVAAAPWLGWAIVFIVQRAQTG